VLDMHFGVFHEAGVWTQPGAQATAPALTRTLGQVA